MFSPESVDPGEDIKQAVHAEPAGSGEVGRGKERLFLRCHDDGKGPSPLAGHHLADGHIHAVDIGMLLAVHLDADKILV